MIYILLFCKLPFHSADGVFWCTKVLDLDVVQFLFFFYCYLCFWYHIYKKSLPNPMSWSFSLMISSKSFIVLAFIFRTSIHFELILYIVEAKGLSSFLFFFWHVDIYLVFPEPFVKKFVLSPLKGLGMC